MFAWNCVWQVDFLKEKSALGRKELPHISSSQVVTANPVVESDTRVYWSAIYAEEIIKVLCVFAYRKMLSRSK